MLDTHITLTKLEGRAWQASSRGIEIVTDSSRESGGEDRGMTPVELLVSAVGGCMALDLAYYAERHPGIDLSRARFDLSWESSAERPRRVAAIHGILTLPADLHEDERDAVLRVVSSCKVRRSIEGCVDIRITVQFAEY